MGFDAELVLENSQNLSQQREQEELAKYRYETGMAFIFASPTFFISMIVMMVFPEDNSLRMFFMQEIIDGLTVDGLVTFLLATPVQFWLGKRFYKGAYSSVFHTHSANVKM